MPFDEKTYKKNAGLLAGGASNAREHKSLAKQINSRMSRKTALSVQAQTKEGSKFDVSRGGRKILEANKAERKAKAQKKAGTKLKGTSKVKKVAKKKAKKRA